VLIRIRDNRLSAIAKGMSPLGLRAGARDEGAAANLGLDLHCRAPLYVLIQIRDNRLSAIAKRHVATRATRSRGWGRREPWS
jgi:hypothetical protein